MNFFEKIFGFFSRFFSSSEKNEISVQFNEVEAFIAKSSSEQESELKQFLASKFSEIRYLLKTSHETISEIEQKEISEEEGNPQLRKIVNTSRSASLRHLKPLLEKLQPPNLNDIMALKVYCEQSAFILEKEIISNSRNLAYTSVLVKEEFKKLGENLDELHKIFLELRNTIAEKKGIFLASKTKKIMCEIESKLNEIGQNEIEKKTAAEQVSLLEGRKKSLKDEMSILQNSNEFRETELLNGKKSKLFAEKQEIKTKIIELFSNIERPLKKFNNLVESQNVSIPREEKELLEVYLTNPFSALKMDVKAEGLKGILKSVKKAVEENIVELDEREKEKRLNALGELISFDFFENVFWKINQIDVKINEVEQGLLSGNVSQKLSETENEIRKIESELFEKRNFLKFSEDMNGRNLEKIGILKAMVEELAGEITGKKVTIV